MLKKPSARSAGRWQKQKWWKAQNCSFNSFTGWKLLIEIEFSGTVPQCMMRPAPLYTDLSVPTHSSVAHNIHRTALHKGKYTGFGIYYRRYLFRLRFRISCHFITFGILLSCAGMEESVCRYQTRSAERWRSVWGPLTLNVLLSRGWSAAWGSSWIQRR